MMEEKRIMYGNGLKEKIIKVENIQMRLGGMIEINDMRFEVKRGDINEIIGKNGEGKKKVLK